MKKKLIEIPNELFDKIVQLSIENDRSVNKQINSLLKNAIFGNLDILPNDKNLKEMVTDGDEMDYQNKERLRIAKYVRDKCLETLSRKKTL